MKETNQVKQYNGLLGLDNITPAIKVFNFIITVIIGAWMVWNSTIHPVSFPTIQYEPWPLSWPLVFALGPPIGLVVLWLRLTGLKWSWGLLAAFVSLILPFLIVFIYTVIYIIIFGI